MREIYSFQAEANSKVWAQRKHKKKAMPHLTKIDDKYANTNKDMADVDQEIKDMDEVIVDKTEKVKHADGEADDATKRLRMARGHHRNIAKNGIEEGVNGLLVISRLPCVRLRQNFR